MLFQRLVGPQRMAKPDPIIKSLSCASLDVHTARVIEGISALCHKMLDGPNIHAGYPPSE